MLVVSLFGDTVRIMRRRFLSALLVLASLGTAVVVAVGPAPSSEAALVTALANCLTTDPVPDRQKACVATLAESSLKERGLARTSSLLLDAVRASGRTGALACHYTQESLGAEYARLVGARALDDLVYSCLGGPMHGVFYTLGESLPAQEVARLSAGVCERLATTTPWLVGWDCRHGVGHAMGLDGGSSPLESFLLCEDVYSDEEYRHDCATGVVSSLVARVKGAEDVEEFDPYNLSRWCYANLQGAGILKGCVTFAGVLLGGMESPLEVWATQCEQGDLDCIYGLGIGAGVPFNTWTPRQRMDVCMLFDGQGRRACVAGVVRELTPDYHLLEQDTGFCAVTGELEAFCRARETRMKQREMTLEQLADFSKVDPAVTSDPAGWPFDLSKP